MQVLGVDGTRDGWVGVALGDGGLRVHHAADLPTLLERVDREDEVTHVGIDIPIGLTDDVPREADRAAQRVLGRRRSSIFVTPVRSALLATDHASGVRRNREALGTGFSIQAWGLRSKVLEVDDLVRAGEGRLFEVHPEVTFAEMGHAPAAHPKKTWAGQRERLDLLCAAGLDLGQLAGDPGRAAPDDVVDAAACLWTTLRIRDGSAHTLPAPPQPVAHGMHAAIWV